MSSASSSISEMEKGAHSSVDEILNASLHSSEDSHEEDSNIPNGGLVAWVQVLGAFFLWFNTW